MEEQFQRMSEKVFWHVFLTSRAAWMTVCISSRLLRHSWAWDDTIPGRSLQCWVWLIGRDEGVCDSALQGTRTRTRFIPKKGVPSWPMVQLNISPLFQSASNFWLLDPVFYSKNWNTCGDNKICKYTYFKHLKDLNALVKRSTDKFSSHGNILAFKQKKTSHLIYKSSRTVWCRFK